MINLSKQLLNYNEIVNMFKFTKILIYIVVLQFTKDYIGRIIL